MKLPHFWLLILLLTHYPRYLFIYFVLYLEKPPNNIEFLATNWAALASPTAGDGGSDNSCPADIFGSKN